MRTLINNIIRFAALLSVISMFSMLIGWQKVDMIAVSVDLIMVVIWISSEYELITKKNG
ncbi:hypothetical protein TUM17564_39010 [Citrobacter freundii]|uniref:hypothetical protein n=1 Tax=Citrobacter freundii TaxID=546 RepID=UPI001E36B3F8|nr:hypothetical protein [Citrobacter freundii]GJK71874.1 hypothetical protein TUM17564_39010 [Citrobacter freundii]